MVLHNWQNVDEMNRLLETEALQHSFKYCTTLKKSHTLIIQHIYLKNKLIVDALLWCDWFPFSLSHLLYFPFFITWIHIYIQLLLAQRKDLKVRSPKAYCRQCTLCLLQQYKMENNQYTITRINNQDAIQIKLYDHSWLFHQFFKKLAIIERLFWQGLSSGTKKCL